MTDLKSGLTAGHHFSFATLNGHLYAANGWDKMQRWNGVGSTSSDAGVDDPPQNWTASASTTSGNCTVGAHLIRYRYKSKDTGYISNPSNHVVKTIAASNEQLTITIDTSGGGNILRSTDSKMDLIVIEMTSLNATTFYEAVEVANSASSVVVSISDTDLAGKLLNYEDSGHNPPPYFSIVMSHRGRLFGAGQVSHTTGTVAVTNGSASVTGTGSGWTASVVDRFMLVGTDTKYYKILSTGGATAIVLDETYTGSTASGVSYRIFSLAPNTIYESKRLYPESWPALNYTKALVNRHDQIKAMVPYYGDLLVVGNQNTERWAYSETLIGDGQPYQIPGRRGAVNQRCVVEVDGVVYGWDRQGIWKWSGGVQDHISYPVDPLWQIMNWAVDSTFHVVFIPIERTIRFYWARDDSNSTDTLPKDFLEYNIEKGIWGTGHHIMAITSSATIGTGSELRAILGDENGHVWYIVGTTEGAHPTSTTVGTVIASPSPTTTQFSISEGSLYTTGDALKGVPCYVVEADEERIISANTATQITVGTAYSSAPTAGHTVYIGRINSILKTKAVSLSRLTERGRARYLHVFFEPTSTQKILIIRIYRDYSATATNWSGTTTDLTPGVDVVDGSPKISVDLSNSDGYARVPIGMNSARTMEVQFEILGPKSGLQLVGWEIDGMVDEYERMGK